MSKLPQGWDVTALEPLITYVLGGDWGTEDSDAIPESFSRVKIIRGTEFKDWEKERGATGVIRLVKTNSLEKRQLIERDIVVEVSGGGPTQPVGRVVFIDKTALENSKYPLICSNFFRQIRLNSLVESRYFYHFLKYANQVGILNEFQTQTTNLRNLNFNDFVTDLDIPLPPLNEQRRIVAKLEKLLAKCEACKQRLDKIPGILKRFRQSILAAACSGRLTADWREQQDNLEIAEDLIEKIFQSRKRRYANACKIAKESSKRKPANYDNYRPSLRTDLEVFDLPTEWNWVDLRFLMDEQEPFCYGVVQPGENDPQGTFLIRAGDLKNRTVSLSGLRKIPLDIDEEYSRSKIVGGEILITVVGANIGVASIAPRECKGFNIARAVAKVPIKDFVAEYILLWLQSSTAIHWMKGDAREVARPTLNLEQLKSLVVPLSPLAEQREIVQRVEKLFKLAEQIEQRYQKARAYVDKLPQSILAKAFRGELVPQDPNDEPTSILLERIRAEREKQSEGAKGKSKRARKQGRTRKQQALESEQMNLLEEI